MATEATVGVAAGDDLLEAEVADRLVELVDQSLVVVERERGPCGQRTGGLSSPPILTLRCACRPCCASTHTKPTRP